MRSANRVSQWWRRLTSRSSQTFIVDVGSAVTKVAVVGRSAVPRLWSEATCLAWHPATGAVASFGDRALKLLGRTPDRLAVVFPIKKGVVKDQAATVEYLKTLKQILSPPTFSGALLKPKVIGVVPSNLSTIEQQLFVATFEQAGWAVDQLVPALVALNKVLQHRYPQQHVRVVITIGDQLTQLGIFSQDVPLLLKTFLIGGRTYTSQVLHTIKSEYGYEVGWQTAEQLKQQLGECSSATEAVAGKAHKEKKMVVRGKSLTDYTVNSVTISNRSFGDGFATITAELLGEIKDALQEVPADVLTTGLESGIHLSGGGSLLLGLSDRVGAELGCEVIHSRHPELDTVSPKAYPELQLESK